MEFIAVLLPFLFFTVFFLKKLRIPTIFGYIGVGFVLSYFFPFLKDIFEIKELFFFQKLAVTLLFFFIGLEFPFKQIINIIKYYKISLIDFFINFFSIFLISSFFVDMTTALLLALIFYPSSTSIIARLSMEYKRLANKETPFLFNILIFEDLILMVVLTFFTPILTNQSLNLQSFYYLFLKLAAILLLFYIVRKFFLKYLKTLFIEAQKEDYFILFLIGTLLFLDLVMAKIGLIEYLGSFLFGSLIAEIKKERIVYRYLIPFKEFSLSIFFFLFGLNLDVFSINLDNICFVILISLVAIVSKIFSTYLALYKIIGKKEALIGAFSFIPRGEFSIILASLNPSLQTIIFPSIVITLLIGMICFLFAEKISNYLTKTVNFLKIK